MAVVGSGYIACELYDAFRKLELPNPIRPCASVVRLWHELPDDCKLTEPVPGVWAFHQDLDDHGTPTPFGHMGFIDDLDPAGEGTYSICGNTNSEGLRTGGGVWRHTPRIRSLAYWNLGYADYSAVAPLCLPLVDNSGPDVVQ